MACLTEGKVVGEKETDTRLVNDRDTGPKNTDVRVDDGGGGAGDESFDFLLFPSPSPSGRLYSSFFLLFFPVHFNEEAFIVR